MPRILVVDDMPIFRDPVAASLRLAGYDAVGASNGTEALAAIAANRPDLVLLDLAMPGTDGLCVLRAVRNRPDWADIPVIVLTAVTDRNCILQAGALGAREYMLKSRFSLQELLDRIRKHLLAASPLHAPAAPSAADAFSPAATDSITASAAVSNSNEAPRQSMAPPDPAPEIPRLMSRADCISRTRSALQVKSLSGVVSQVISLAASPRADLPALASLIAHDAALSARVLQVANSAAYLSRRGVVASIPEAVRNIGCASIRDIALSLAVIDAMPAGTGDGFHPIRWWQHSFATAQLCARLCGQSETVAGTAYLAGLCHDLGDILFHTCFADEYAQVLRLQQRTARPLPDLEHDMLGMTRAELVSVIIEHLALPEAIVGPIAAMHAAAEDRRLAPADTLARVLIAADAYANGLLLAGSMVAPLHPLTRAACKNATGQPDPPAPEGEAFRSQIFALTAILARLPRREEAQLMAPLFARQPVRLWLARDSMFSSFDPVLAALQALASVTVADHLPHADQAAQHDGIVVVARSAHTAGFTLSDIEPPTRANEQRRPLLWLVCQPPEASADVALSPVRLPVPLTKMAELANSAAATARPARAA